MMSTNPEQFARVAREWAVKYAGAPAQASWQPKGPLFTSAPPKSKGKQSNEDPLRQYVTLPPYILSFSKIFLGTKATIKTSSIVL